MDKKRILLVDDEKDMIEYLSLRLEAAGYEVIFASDGQDALNKARSLKPNLIILDLILPKLDGYQVCRMLKFDRNLRNIPLIMLTALNREEDKEWGEKVKADVYMTKPFDSKELMKKIEELLILRE